MINKTLFFCNTNYSVIIHKHTIPIQNKIFHNYETSPPYPKAAPNLIWKYYENIFNGLKILHLSASYYFKLKGGIPLKDDREISMLE